MSQKFQMQVLPKNEILLWKEPVITSDPQTAVFGFRESLRRNLFIKAYTTGIPKRVPQQTTSVLPQQCLNLDTKKAGIQIVTQLISVNFTLVLYLSAWSTHIKESF